MRKCLGSLVPHPMDLAEIEKVSKWPFPYQVEFLVCMSCKLCNRCSPVDVYKCSGEGFKKLTTNLVTAIISGHYPSEWRDITNVGKGSDSSATGWDATKLVLSCSVTRLLRLPGMFHPVPLLWMKPSKNEFNGMIAPWVTGTLLVSFLGRRRSKSQVGDIVAIFLYIK